MGETFIINISEIEGRIDPAYYKPEFRELKKLIKSVKIKKLGDIANFQYGLNEIAQESGDIFYIRITDIDEYGLLKKDGLTYLKYKNEYKNYRLKREDILIARIGATFGKSYFFNENFDALFAGYLIRIRLKSDEIIPKFLFYYFQTKFFWRQAIMLVKGGAQPQFNANTIKDLLIPLPPSQTQNRIVSIMDKAYILKKSNEIETRKLLDSINDYLLDELKIKLSELKDKMIYVVDSGDIQDNRIDAYYYQPKFEEVEKIIKKGKYEVKETINLEILNKLEDIRDYEYINYVDLASINKDFGIIKDHYKLNINEAPSRARQKIEKGDLLLSGLNGSLKSIAIFDGSFNNAICSTGFYVIKNSKNYNNYYLWALFRNPILQMILQRESSGAIMSAINRKALLSIRIPLPPLEIQNRIAEEIKKRIQKAEQLQKETNEELHKAKQEVEEIILG